MSIPYTHFDSILSNQISNHFIDTIILSFSRITRTKNYSSKTKSAIRFAAFSVAKSISSLVQVTLVYVTRD